MYADDVLRWYCDLVVFSQKYEILSTLPFLLIYLNKSPIHEKKSNGIFFSDSFGIWDVFFLFLFFSYWRTTGTKKQMKKCLAPCYFFTLKQVYSPPCYFRVINLSFDNLQHTKRWVNKRFFSRFFFVKSTFNRLALNALSKWFQINFIDFTQIPIWNAIWIHF